MGLLTTLAALENYSVWVDGDTLNFHPEASQMSGDSMSSGISRRGQ
jgi:hypothetical protein